MVRRAPRILVVLGACLLMVMSIGGTAFAAGGPGTHPVIDTVSKLTVAPDTNDLGTGCGYIHVTGHGFFPSYGSNINGAFVVVIASANGNATFVNNDILTVDSKGKINEVIQVCDVSVIPDLLEWSALDLHTYYWANRDYTKVTGTLSTGVEEPLN